MIGLLALSRTQGGIGSRQVLWLQRPPGFAIEDLARIASLVVSGEWRGRRMNLFVTAARDAMLPIAASRKYHTTRI